MTAAGLLALIGEFGPAVEGGELVFAVDLPAALIPLLSVLHTGVRALLAGRRWWGSASDRPLVTELSPVAPIPPGITLLCVEGDPRWDRIDPAARVELAYLFASAGGPGPSGRGPKRHPSRERA